MVNGIIEAVRGAKLEPVSLDLNAFALLRALAPRDVVAPAGGELLVGIGATVTNVVVHEHGVPRFVRILLLGGDAVTDGLMARGDLDYRAAEEVKARTGIVVDDFAFGDPHAAVIAERADRLVAEIRGSLDYYAAQPDAVAVHRVVLTGGGSRLRGFRERLQSALQLPVEEGRALAHVEVPAKQLAAVESDGAEQLLAVAVGLAQGEAA
jgi:type IV pilus assembly protein PilM